MENKVSFINWISKNKLKNISPEDFSKLMENIFLRYLNVDIWDINNHNEFSSLRNKLLANSDFKKKDKKEYKLFNCNSKCYQNYLKCFYSKNNSDAIRVDTPSAQQDNAVEFVDDYNLIFNFFDNKSYTDLFYLIYIYFKNHNSKFMLDVRSTIIGIKIENERLRIYSDKCGIVHFGKKIKVNVNLEDYNNKTIGELYSYIDEINNYFETHSDEIMLKNDDDNYGYVYHKAFGFGTVMQKDQKYIIVKFDDYSEVKKIESGHHSFCFIDEEQYRSKEFKNSEDESSLNKKNVTKRIEWDKYETALLIEAYFKIENKEDKRKEILLKLSNDLRRRATNSGLIIDETFRNMNGMNLQMSNLASVLHPEKYFMHKTSIFEDMVLMLKNNISEFEKVLAEAHNQIDRKVSNDEKKDNYSISLNEVDFYTFVKEMLSQENLSDSDKTLIDAKSVIDDLRKVNSYMSVDVFSINSPYVIEKMIDDFKSVGDLNIKDDSDACTNALKFYLKFLYTSNEIIDNDEDSSDYYNVLLNSFADGYSYNNPLRKRKFISVYEEINNKKFIDNDDLYLRKLQKVGFLNEGKVYLTKMVPEPVFNEINEYLVKKIKNVNSVIYYTEMFDLFSDKLGPLFNLEMFKSYLKFVFSTQFVFCEEYICDYDSTFNLKQEVINVFVNKGRPLTIEEIYKALPYVSQDAVDETIHEEDFLVNIRGKSYFYKDVFMIDDNQLLRIENYISDTIATKDIVSGKELFDFTQKNIPEVLEINTGYTEQGLKNFLKMKLGTKFNFRGDVICKNDQVIDVRMLYKEFCEERENFTLEEIESFRDEINKSYIDWNCVFQNDIRVDEHHFVRKDLIDFDIDKIDKAIEFYYTGQYVPFDGIVSYLMFPPIGYIWNTYILESYLNLYSRKFKLVHASFNSEKPVGAIVSVNSKINDFDDLIKSIIKKEKLFDKEMLFAFLLENSFIKTKKIKNIEYLINEAKKEL